MRLPVFDPLWQLVFSPITYAGNTSQTLEEVQWKADNDRINTLVQSLAPKEKISLVAGTPYSGSQNFAGYINAVPGKSIPAIQMSDGESGINGVLNTTSIPSQVNIAASFDRWLAYAAGLVAGKEARLLNSSVALAPRVNIIRDPCEGSAWQGYSEDPYLNSQLGAYGVRGIQEQGTMANSKQIGPSSTGASFGDFNSEVDLQTLHEVYWYPHEELVNAGVATIMCSYAKVNGVPSCEYEELLNLTLRGDYNFTGIVMSDWGATHSTAPSLIAGLDIEMGTNTYYTQPLYDQIYVYKNLSESYLDRALYHILSMYEKFGILDGHGPQGNSTDQLLTANNLPDFVVKESQNISAHIAVRTGVLLKNQAGVLPLDNLSSIAVIGATGLQLTNGAGFAERSFGFNERKIAPVDAIANAAPSVNVSSCVGVDMHGSLVPASAFVAPNGQPGLQRNDSLTTTIDSLIDFHGPNALPGNTSYTWTGKLVVNTTGYYRLALQRRFPSFGGPVNDSSYLSVFSVDAFTIDGMQFNGFRLQGDGGTYPWSSPLPTEDFWDENGADVYLTVGAHNLTIDVAAIFGDPIELRLHWVIPEQRAANIQAAVSLARTVDVPIVFAHANSPPQVGMQLIEGHNDLIAAVAAVNPSTVAVLHSADPVLMPWLDAVAGVLWMGHPGQEGGPAVAKLLLGLHNPQGRLPLTYPASLNSSMTRNPAYPNRVHGVNDTAVFSEGVNVGYRWYLHENTSVLFPFGFGLSYTAFDYSNLLIRNTSAESFDVSFDLRNVGERKGAEVPQMYIGPPQNAGERYPGVQFAAAALAGFESVELQEGGSERVTFPVSARQLSFWNQTSRGWVVAKGTRELWIATDAQTPVLKGSLTV